MPRHKGGNDTQIHFHELVHCRGFEDFSLGFSTDCWPTRDEAAEQMELSRKFKQSCGRLPDNLTCELPGLGSQASCCKSVDVIDRRCKKRYVTISMRYHGHVVIMAHDLPMNINLWAMAHMMWKVAMPNGRVV